MPPICPFMHCLAACKLFCDFWVFPPESIPAGLHLLGRFSVPTLPLCLITVGDVRASFQAKEESELQKAEAMAQRAINALQKQKDLEPSCFNLI